MQIEITLPNVIPPQKAKFLIEGAIKEKSNYSCVVEYNGFEDGENVYTISSGNIEAFYLAGITASLLINKYNG